MNPSASFLAGRQNTGSEIEISTIEKQRKELQLLIGELKDRDKELNDMVAVHQRQLLSWEEDRQKVLTLEERCSKLEGELHKRTEIIRSLTKKVKTLESNQIECQAALQKTQLQLQEMAQKATHSSLLSEDLEARNENLSNTLVELSAQVGQLQAREQALTTMIKLKDKDIIEAVNHIADCSGKFKLLEHALRDAKMVESCIVKEKQDYKQKLKVLKMEVNKLKEDLNEKTTENNEQREEIIRLKQEKSCLHDELVFTEEREKRKDELLDIAKSKQERMNAELHNLRQIYVKQQRDLQFLNFNVENSQELIQIYDSKMEESKALESSRDMCLSDLENNHLKVDFKREKNQKSLVKDQKFETTSVQQNRSDKSSCDVCKEKKLQVNTSFGGKSVIAISSLFAKDLVEKQKSWSLGAKIQTEPENTSTFCKIHAKSPKGNGIGVQNEEKQLSETSTSVSDEKWHDVSVYLGLANCSASKQPEKLDTECHDQLERSRVSCCHKNEACLDESDMWESKCCHPSNFVIEAPGHMSDVEWMSIFKPSKVQRVVRHKSVCTCAESASGTKYNSSTSELIAIQHSRCLGSSQSALREDEKLRETESSSDKKNSPKMLLINKDAALPSEKDDFSPTSKLQRLLAESRQMVTDLELSTLLPISSENLSTGAKNMVEPGQDLLLAALSESGISPNDLFDIDGGDAGLATLTPTPPVQQSVPLSALELNLETEAAVPVKQEPETVSTPALLNVRQQPPSTTTFVLNQINQLPTLGSTIVMTKTPPVTTNRQTITLTKFIQTTANTRPSVSAPAVRNAMTSAPSKDQVQLKDLLKNNSLNELMKLKPPANIAQPVATAATDVSNGTVKKESSNKEVARIWINDVKMRSFSPTMKVPVVKEEDEPEEEDEEEMGHAETYAEYMPIKLKIGLRHPDAVVETSSLSSVTPPDVWYKTSISEETIDNGWLSALQLEAITYAAQQHETFLPNGDRAGFLIGDGAGVGKGRTIAGIIYENYLLSRKRALWFSVSNDLKYDAERDLRDIGAKNILVHSLNKFKYGKISSKHNGSVKKGVIFATYSSLIGESQSGGKYKTRLKQLLHWCGDDFDGVIVFDECHKAKNLCPVGSSKPTKTGLAVLELQNKLPKARVVYASATGASEPRNMAYMNRLGIWGEGTPFREFSDFIQAVERRGVGAMEIVAMDMKLRGMYIARQLSFTGVTFKIEEVLLSQSYVKMYNKAVKLWVIARERFQQAADLIDAEQRMKKSMWGQFWSAHQRFFKYLCIASKVKRVVQLAREEIKNGKCVVIGLQSTGEARTLEALEEGGGELNDFVSTAKGVLQSLIEKHFPAPDRKKLYSLLGIDLTAPSNNSSPRDSPCKENKIKKRKGEEITREAKKARKVGGLTGSSSDDSGSGSDASDNEESDYESSKNMSSGDDDDFNPFRDESSEDDEDDPWLIRKDHKKNKDKKKRKSIDPDSIQSALLASGLGSKRPSFSSTPVISPTPNSAPANSNINSNSSLITSQDAVERAQQMKKDLLDKLEKLAEDLPPNTLDELIDELGGPENVAEMTGRKGRVVSNDDGSISYESRSELDVPVEILNITEKQRFMDGDKNIAIISEAASSGISLQADRRAKNQRRRVHMTLELPWSADRAIQQFGRTHRSNQVTAPEYVFLISELAGEQRFASIVAKRLESLGALTHGDRRATESRDLSRFNFDNKYGRNALEIVMKSIVNLDSPMVSPPPDYPGEFFKDVRQGLIGVGLINVEDRSGILTLDKDYNNIGKFLNRILGMEVHQQNALFQYFADTLTAVVQNAKKNGRYDMGILDLGSGDEKVRKSDVKKFLTPGYSTSGHVELYTISVERGMSWEEATKIWAELTGPDDGFYLSLQIRNNKKTAILVKEVNPKKKLFLVYRPNTGKQLKLEIYADLKKKYKKVVSDDALVHWLDQYNSSADTCTHAYWRGNCKKASLGLVCEIGLRCRTYYVLCGSVLSVWTKVEGVLASVSGTNVKMQIVRLRTEDGQRIVGLIIPANCVSPLVNLLSTSDQSQQLAVQQKQLWQQRHPQSIANLSNA